VNGSLSDAQIEPGRLSERYVITVAFELREGACDRFLDLVRANAAASLAFEQDCLCFDVLLPIVAGQPEVVLYEVYANRAAFDLHVASRHFAEFDAATRDMVSKKTVSEYSMPDCNKSP
jgi:(4S)-4-hydroxy-5-phosphonooxypentane-2,3-dione isomerase